MNAAGPLQDFLTHHEDSPAVSPGERVALHLSNGEVIEATISKPGHEPGIASRITAKSKTWTRWAGTPDDLIAIVEKAVEEIGLRSSEAPAVSIQIHLNGGDEERYVDKAVFESEIRSAAPGAPGARLRDVRAISIAIGPTHADSLMANAIFSQAGTTLVLEGADRTVVSGLKEELSPMIDAGRPRVPALPQPAQMFVGGIAGLAYYLGLSSIDWNFLPDGLLGLVMGGLLYLVGFIALIYAVIAGMRSLLPALSLNQPGQKTQSQQWKLRISKGAGSLLLAAFPFALERILA